MVPLATLAALTFLALLAASPPATGVIVLLFATCLPLQRNDIRDRFIRLGGNGDIPRAIAALGEA